MSNVRASADRVALGEAEATLIYVTDVTPWIEDQVEVIRTPLDLNVVATYPIAILKGARNTELAQKLIELALSDEGQSVPNGYGFERAA